VNDRIYEGSSERVAAPALGSKEPNITNTARRTDVRSEESPVLDLRIFTYLARWL